jgi:hypothetical protein
MAAENPVEGCEFRLVPVRVTTGHGVIFKILDTALVGKPADFSVVTKATTIRGLLALHPKGSVAQCSYGIMQNYDNNISDGKCDKSRCDHHINKKG